MARMVVIDQGASAYQVIKQLLGSNHRVEFSDHPTLALDYVREHHPDVVFLNIDEEPAIDLIADMSLKAARSPVVAITGTGELQRVVAAVQRGACDVVPHPIQVRDLHMAVTRALARRQLTAGGSPQAPTPEIIGTSAAVVRLRREIGRVAAERAPVVITGESGVGKELVAEALHRLSGRASGPFEVRNCGAIPDQLLESELFGTERGAYTDAIQRSGAFERANGGTLFLDEIGELSLAAQVKLLRALETGTYHRVGGTALRRTDARFVAATNRDLRQLMRSGKFREDLYYRIDVFRIAIPPLRERREDIPGLAEYFVRTLRDELVTGAAERFAPDALERLTSYHWPGNVRELRNVVWRALAHARGTAIRADELSFE